jgi:hypothetical protein
MEDSMTRLLTAFVALMLFSGSTYQQDVFGHVPPRYVDADDGGIIGDYIARVERSIRWGQEVIIRGLCASACTYELNSMFHCVMPGALLFFHSTPYAPNDEGYKKDMLALYYKPRLAKFIVSHGGLTAEGWYVWGAELVEAGVSKQCK